MSWAILQTPGRNFLLRHSTVFVARQGNMTIRVELRRAQGDVETALYPWFGPFSSRDERHVDNGAGPAGFSMGIEMMR